LTVVFCHPQKYRLMNYKMDKYTKCLHWNLQLNIYL